VFRVHFRDSFINLNKLSDLITHTLIVSEIRQMAIVVANFPGFNDLGRSVTPTFLLMDYFPYRFSTISEKTKKIYRLEV